MKTHANFVGCSRNQPRLPQTFTLKPQAVFTKSLAATGLQALQAQATVLDTRNAISELLKQPHEVRTCGACNLANLPNF